MSAVIFQVTVT